MNTEQRSKNIFPYIISDGNLLFLYQAALDSQILYFTREAPLDF